MEKLSPVMERTGNPVPCPRCQSLNTKFCYYNNRNPKQPRHFCKGCQRYWTEGGSLRNVPIGAGKRKHKGPHPAPTKPENTANVFSFYPDQGVYTPSLEQPNVLSFKQHAHSYGESKLVEMPCAVPQEPVVSESRPQATQAFASLHQKPASYDAANAVPQASAFVCPRGSEKVGLSEWRKQPSLSLGLNNLAKEANLQQGDAKLVSHSDKDALHPTPSQQNACKPESRPAQHNTERDESTGCSSVTTNLGPSVLEPVEVSNNPEMKSPTMPPQSTSLLNPMVALGASMCPPWLWPFMSGHNAVPPASFPQVDPTLAAATVGAMASMPPINPAFAAAMGAMACSGRLPQIDPNVMAAVSASFLQFPQLWSPYMWGLPWSTAWNTANAVVNMPNGVSKKHPASLDPEQGGASKFAKGENLREASRSTCMRSAESVKSPNILCSAGYADACGLKPDVSPLKPPVPLQFGMRLDTGQQQVSPHSNPAAQARSAAFQEGN